ncbi:MAG: adenylate/guanylate cyclase domain-containing protein [Pseudomonadota bacterium]
MEVARVTVMFVDLIGSVRFALEIEPGSFDAAIGAWQRAVTTEVERQGGEVIRLLGDGVLAIFRDPDQSATQAVTAALQIHAELGEGLAETSPRPRIRIGIATGDVMVRGNDWAISADVFGQTPNIAARLQERAEPGTIVISGATRERLGRGIETESLGAYLLPGISEMLTAYRVIPPPKPASLRRRVEILREVTPPEVFTLSLGTLSHRAVGGGPRDPGAIAFALSYLDEVNRRLAASNVLASPSVDIGTYRMNGDRFVVSLDRLDPGSIRLSARLELVVTLVGVLAAYVPMKAGVAELYADILWAAQQTAELWEEERSDSTPLRFDGTPELHFRPEEEILADLDRRIGRQG